METLNLNKRLGVMTMVRGARELKKKKEKNHCIDTQLCVAFFVVVFSLMLIGGVLATVPTLSTQDRVPPYISAGILQQGKQITFPAFGARTVDISIVDRHYGEDSLSINDTIIRLNNVVLPYAHTEFTLMYEGEDGNEVVIGHRYTVELNVNSSDPHTFSVLARDFTGNIAREHFAFIPVMSDVEGTIELFRGSIRIELNEPIIGDISVVFTRTQGEGNNSFFFSYKPVYEPASSLANMTGVPKTGRWVREVDTQDFEGRFYTLLISMKLLDESAAVVASLFIILGEPVFHIPLQPTMFLIPVLTGIVMFAIGIFLGIRALLPKKKERRKQW